MSKLILDLAKEAGLIEFEPLSWNPELQAPNPESAAKAYKFAELIVRKCSGILRTEANSNWEGREERLLNAMADWIEKHFGIE